MTCLTVSSCLTKGDVPPLPQPNKFQPIIEQILCDDSGKNCTLKSMCQEWAIDPATNKWVLIKSHPLKKCHGIIGVTADGYNQYRDYNRVMTDWIPNHCKLNK